MMTTWDKLNERQQFYLKSIFDLDQSTEVNRKWLAARGLDQTPARVWRWIPYNAGRAYLQTLIENAGYRDEGTGSTFEALRKRGFILLRYEPGSLRQPIISVQITRQGRALIREAFGLEAPKSLPAGTLREWHWKALVHAYKCGDQGVTEWPRGIGDSTIRRLEDYTVKGELKPLLAYALIPCEPFQRQKWPYYDQYEIATERNLLKITDVGKLFYEERWQLYREMYPDVDAPAPTPGSLYEKETEEKGSSEQREAR